MYRTYIDFVSRVRVANHFSQWYPMTSGIHQGGILSLTKYIIFINGLLDEIESSNLCCTIGPIVSSPASYADNLAAATLSKKRTDAVHDIVKSYGDRWRFKFNASKSAVLVFGEDKKTNDFNKKHRVFRLGKEWVKEKKCYDHVGVKMSIFGDCTERVEEKISKGRKTLNASTGLGIRRNGLNMNTCNVIFWQVVVPTICFGSEVWVSSDKDEEMLLAFQIYAGKRVQRFPYRAPNSSSYYGLGWLKLTSYIRVKKLLFILTILKMDQSSLLRQILGYRLNAFSKDLPKNRMNLYRSPLYDIFNTAISFGVFEVVRDMALSNIPVASKNSWSKLIWNRAWSLEDANWKAANCIMKDNDLLNMTMDGTHYLTWWWLSDFDYRAINMCEKMCKIVCHASRLKRDDQRLKGQCMSNRACEKCDLFCIEDILHIINVCPYYYQDQCDMHSEIYTSCPNAKKIFERETKDVPYFLLGKSLPEMGIEEMTRLWCIAGKWICKMYRDATVNRVGIG